MATFADILGAQQVVHRGNQEVFRCPFHDDGESTKSWSCHGYPDGRFYCFSCKSNGSLIDLAIFLDIGRVNPKGKKITQRDEHGNLTVLDPEMFEAYKRANVLLGTLPGTSAPVDPTRAFTETEIMFLDEVRKMMHDALDTDTQARSYLRMRGCDSSWSCFGVARPSLMPHIHSLAAEFGDKELPRSTGLESRHPEYIGKMYYGLMDSVVVFNQVPLGCNYFQARTLRTNRDNKYYNPIRIKKVPICFGEGPQLVVEGFYKAAWAVPYGFQVVAIHGLVDNGLPASFWRSIAGQTYLSDNDPPDEKGVRHGDEAALLVRNRVQDEGGDIFMLMPPDPYKDPDIWAETIGYANAANSIRTQREAFYGKPLLSLTLATLVL